MIDEALDKGGHLGDDVAYVVCQHHLERDCPPCADAGGPTAIFSPLDLDFRREVGRRELDPLD